MMRPSAEPEQEQYRRQNDRAQVGNPDPADMVKKQHPSAQAAQEGPVKHEQESQRMPGGNIKRLQLAAAH